MSKFRSASAVLAAFLAFVPITAAYAAASAAGEPSRTRPQAALAWKASAFPSSATPEIRYREMPIQRLLQLQRANARRIMKPTQIGLPRFAAMEATHAPIALRWVPVGRGGFVARTQVRSPDALALRVALDLARLDDRIEMRFGGSDDRRKVVAAMRVGDMRQLRGDDGLFWTPSTDGEVQLIELYRRAGVPAPSAPVQAPKVSHLLAASHNGFKILEKIGESGSCNVDTACRVTELGADYVNAKNAVAHMQFVKGGSTYICTGTLLADTTASTQVPYFYTAHHCFGDGAPVASSMQLVANTLNTYWNYEATACNSGVAAPRTMLSGGATYLYSSDFTDGMLLRLNAAAPAGAYFAGWSAEKMKSPTEVIGIHHPRGDVKKVSSGRATPYEGYQQIYVSWLSGTTEGGSSGSAIFTRGPSGLELRGGLYGGSASCANTGSFNNSGNTDYYSRFDMVFFNTSHYLAAEPVARNGSAPLIPPSTLTTASTASGSIQAPAQVAPSRKSRGIDDVRRSMRRRH